MGPRTTWFWCHLPHPDPAEQRRVSLAGDDAGAWLQAGLPARAERTAQRSAIGEMGAQANQEGLKTIILADCLPQLETDAGKRERSRSTES